MVLEIDLDLAIEGRLKESFDGGLIFGIEETSGPFGGWFWLLLREDIFMEVLSDSCKWPWFFSEFVIILFVFISKV